MIIIKIEGPKGSGKTLIANLLKATLANCCVPTISRRHEPDILVLPVLSKQQIKNVISEMGHTNEQGREAKPETGLD